jgi:hypothetical protein
MNAYGGRVDIAQVIIKLGPKWRGTLSFRLPPEYGLLIATEWERGLTGSR